MGESDIDIKQAFGVTDRRGGGFERVHGEGSHDPEVLVGVHVMCQPSSLDRRLQTVHNPRVRQTLDRFGRVGTEDDLKGKLIIARFQHALLLAGQVEQSPFLDPEIIDIFVPPPGLDQSGPVGIPSESASALGNELDLLQTQWLEKAEHDGPLDRDAIGFIWLTTQENDILVKTDNLRLGQRLLRASRKHLPLVFKAPRRSTYRMSKNLAALVVGFARR